MSEPAGLADYSGLLHVLAGGLGIVADTIIACLARADRQALGLACKALQDEVAPRWRCLHVADTLPAAELLRSKLLHKLRGVEELQVMGLGRHDGHLQDFYRLLLALKRSGARVKAIDMGTDWSCPLRLPPRRSGRLAGQQQDWVLTADSLLQLQPVPHLERLSVRPAAVKVDAALLQPLLRAPALKAVKLPNLLYVTGSSWDLSACRQLLELDVTAFTGYYSTSSSMDLTTCLQGLQPASGLIKLHVHGGVVSSQCLEYISRSLPHLETLLLVDCLLSEPDVGASQHALQKPSFPNLKELRLHGSHILEDPSDLLALRHLFGATTCLQRLFLGYVGSTIILGLPLDSPGLAHLEELTIMEEHTTRHVVIALLGQLARSQRRLQKLTIDTYAYTFDHLTTEDLQAFLDAASPGLKELRLRGFHDHLLHSSLLLALQAANAGVHLDFSD